MVDAGPAICNRTLESASASLRRGWSGRVTDLKRRVENRAARENASRKDD
jgi:hypothetical protein